MYYIPSTEFNKGGWPLGGWQWAKQGLRTGPPKGARTASFGVSYPCTGECIGRQGAGWVILKLKSGVNEVVCHIGGNPIPGFLPPIPDSARSGQNAGRRIGREWTVLAMEVDKAPVVVRKW